MDKIKKWYTITEFVDLDTGEIISKSAFNRMYYKVRSNKKIEIIEKIIKDERIKEGVIRYVTECRRNGQTTMW